MSYTVSGLVLVRPDGGLGASSPRAPHRDPVSSPSSSSSIQLQSIFQVRGVSCALRSEDGASQHQKPFRRSCRACACLCV